MESLQAGCGKICMHVFLVASNSLSMPTGNKAIGPFITKHHSSAFRRFRRTVTWLEVEPEQPERVEVEPQWAVPLFLGDS